MTNRKKRLEKGIESIKEQIEIHEEKRKRAEGEGMIELAGYYEKEIESKKKALEEKQKILDKQ